MKYMMLLAAMVLLVASMAGCASTGPSKPLTPTETQLLSQVITKRVLAPSLTPDKKQLAIEGLKAARLALEKQSADDVLKNLESYLGPENADLAALIVVMFKERVDLTQLPELQGKAYVFAFLAGVEGGLK